jgi:pimeloyl-ACP methyl ester carboxylesterase
MGVSLSMTCGYVTVAEDHAQPSEGTIDLFITRTQPSTGTISPDPMLLLAADLGWSPLYGVEVGWRPVDPALALLPDRIHREVINVDLRGVGHSIPSLFCGEVEALRLTAPGASTGDLSFRPVLLDAVNACRARLVRLGVDLSAYNTKEMALDLDNVRVALGLESFNVESIGTSSGVIFEMLRRNPGHVRAVVMDSPSPPQLDLFRRAIVGTRYATDRLVEICAIVSQCHVAYPDIRGTLQRILAAARQAPTRIGTGADSYEIDDSTLVRELSEGLGDSTLPRDIYEVAAEGPALLDPVIKADPVLGPGYTYSGHDAPNLMYGDFYSIICHDELPFVDHDALLQIAGDEAWYADAYVDSPYTDICAAWDVGNAADDPHRPVISDVPGLILVGGLDAFSPRPSVEQGVGGLSKSWISDLNLLGHNVLAFDACPIAIRNNWLDQPATPPQTNCSPQLVPFEVDPTNR